MSDFALNRRGLFSAGLGAAVLAVSPWPATAQAPMRARIVTGGRGGVFYPYGKGLAEILSAKVPALQATEQVTGGSVDNARLIHKGEADIGFSTVDSAFDAINGLGAYSADGKLDIRVLAVLYDSYLHVVADAAAGVSRIADLKGKRVSVGSPGSSTEAIADRVMTAAGLDPKRDIVRDNLGVAESAAALKDGKIAAFFWIGGVPTAAVRDLAAAGQPSEVFIPTTENLAAIDKEYPGLYRLLVLPRAAYPGMAADVPCLGVPNVLIVSAKAEDRFVATVLDGIFANLDAIQETHPEAAKLALASAGVATAVPFHPAAEAFYAAKGVLK